MKKTLYTIAYTILFLLLFTSCDSKSQSDNIPFLIKESVSLTESMGTITRNSEYISLYSSDSNILNTIEQMASGNYQAPQGAYIIDISNMSSLINTLTQLDESDISISAETLDLFSNKINAGIFANLINSQYGTSVIASSSITTWQKSYVMPDSWDGNKLIVLIYDGSFSSMISFTESGEGVISAYSIFFKYTEQDNQLKEILNLIQDSSAPNYTQLTLEELMDILQKN